MNDPHVVSLTYTLTTDPPHPYEDFSNVPVLEVDLDGFACRLEERRLIARPREHFPNAESARLIFEPRLRSWEVRAEIEQNVRMHFEYDTAE